MGMSLSIAGAAIASLAAYRWGGVATAAAVRTTLEELLTTILGCQVTISSVELGTRGHVSIKDLHIANPVIKGVTWTEEAIFKIEEVTADLNVQRLVASGNTEIEISLIIVKGLRASYESFGDGWLGMGSSSNLHVVFNHLKSILPARKKPVPAPEPAPEPQPVIVDPTKKKKRVILKKVEIEDIQLDIVGAIAHSLGTTGQHTRLAPIVFEDFSQITPVEGVATVMHFFATTISGSVLYQVTGKKKYHFGDVTQTLANYTDTGDFLIEAEVLADHVRSMF